MDEHEKQKLSLQVADLRSAVTRLKEVLAMPLDTAGTVRDSAIQRFEFSTELSWKTIKTYLSVVHKKVCMSPTTCVRAAFSTELILEDDPFWIEMLNMRNLAAHAYHEDIAIKIYAALPEALKRFEQLLAALEAEPLT